ncbi:MAG: hypothetical protein LBP41_00750 [Holosporaceae bacterium]|jgi:hypothetical protein|nr:hypothetical protein [Holosporaceae bacterium]
MSITQINELLDSKLREFNQLNREKRDYLGASIVGDECLRKIQLQYLQHDADFSAQALRNFAVGHALEPVVAQWLRIAGFHLRVQNNDGKQFGFRIADGRIAGHVDGIICNGPDFCKYPCLWECKTMNDKRWKDATKRGLLVSKPLYYAQVQMYMAYMKLDENPCLFTAFNKDTSELYFELIPFDPETAQRYSDRAALILQASENNETLPRVSEDPSFYTCKMCACRKACLSERGIRE